jgi:glycosyltransferase involved in cell wall biosynthesis
MLTGADATYRRPAARSQPFAAGPATLSLSVVIPALNEEESIGSTVQRCLDARERICRVGHVKSVTVTVVSDGSTDRTAEIAREIASREPSVDVIVFEKNRGYGAAIKEGFSRSSADLVAFLDADGTCDPNVFGELCAAIQREDAALALGSRMGPDSEMPRVRRIGNTLYALLLGTLSGRAVRDTASGMRVIRRSALATLYPLPDGLHFTPAMSARAVMSEQRIVEIPMPYAERVGQSKLSVVRDGVRFLFAIRDAALVYRPVKLFGAAAALCLLFAALLGASPIEHYISVRRVEDWMIYRLLLCGFLCTSAFCLTSAGVMADQILSLVYKRRPTFITTLLNQVFARSRLLMLAVVLSAIAVWLVAPGLWEYWQTGGVTMHWSRPAAALFLLQLAVLSTTHAVVQKVVALWQGQLPNALD